MLCSINPFYLTNKLIYNIVIIAVGVWFNGRILVSKTTDEGSIPSTPAIKKLKH